MRQWFERSQRAQLIATRLRRDARSLFRSKVCEHHAVTRSFLDDGAVRNTVDRKDILGPVNQFRFKGSNFQQRHMFPLPQSSD